MSSYRQDYSGYFNNFDPQNDVLQLLKTLNFTNYESKFRKADHIIKNKQLQLPYNNNVSLALFLNNPTLMGDLNSLLDEHNITGLNAWKDFLFYVCQAIKSLPIYSNEKTKDDILYCGLIEDQYDYYSAIEGEEVTFYFCPVSHSTSATSNYQTIFSIKGAKNARYIDGYTNRFKLLLPPSKLKVKAVTRNNAKVLVKLQVVDDEVLLDSVPECESGLLKWLLEDVQLEPNIARLTAGILKKEEILSVEELAHLGDSLNSDLAEIGVKLGTRAKIIRTLKNQAQAHDNQQEQAQEHEQEEEEEEEEKEKEEKEKGKEVEDVNQKTEGVTSSPSPSSSRPERGYDFNTIFVGSTSSEPETLTLTTSSFPAPPVASPAPAPAPHHSSPSPPPSPPLPPSASPLGLGPQIAFPNASFTFGGTVGTPNISTTPVFDPTSPVFNTSFQNTGDSVFSFTSPVVPSTLAPLKEPTTSGHFRFLPERSQS